MMKPYKATIGYVADIFLKKIRSICLVVHQESVSFLQKSAGQVKLIKLRIMKQRKTYFDLLQVIAMGAPFS